MKQRVPEYEVLDLIINRWSPRAMSGESISNEQLMALFEAAKWAPSSYNNQPWRFIYATRDSKSWQKFLDLLVPFNKEWAQNAAVLIVAISHKNFEYNNKPSRTHSLDTGAATENLMLQAVSMNLVAHGMEGFDYDRAKKELNIPDDYQVEAMYAIGKHAPKEVLSAELQQREIPSDRKKVAQIAFEGEFKQAS